MPELLRLTPEGLYCRAGDFHVDPWRPVPRLQRVGGKPDGVARAESQEHPERAD